jgi:hypothetical protein
MQACAAGVVLGLSQQAYFFLYPAGLLMHPAARVSGLPLQSGVFTQSRAGPLSMPFLDWLDQQAAFAASTAAADAAAVDGPAAKRRRISEQASGTQGTPAGARYACCTACMLKLWLLWKLGFADARDIRLTSNCHAAAHCDSAVQCSQYSAVRSHCTAAPVSSQSLGTLADLGLPCVCWGRPA